MMFDAAFHAHGIQQRCHNVGLRCFRRLIFRFLSSDIATTLRFHFCRHFRLHYYASSPILMLPPHFIDACHDFRFLRASAALIIFRLRDAALHYLY